MKVQIQLTKFWKELIQYTREKDSEFLFLAEASDSWREPPSKYAEYTPYDKLLMDLMYIARPSFIEDLKICFATVKILFEKESTEGVAEGQTTASKSSKK